jgi:hypothetical protein
MADRVPLLVCQKLDDHGLHLGDHDLRLGDHGPLPDVLFPHLGAHGLLLDDRMQVDHDWTSAHQNFLGATNDHLRCVDVKDDRYRLLGVMDDHLRCVVEGLRHLHDAGGLADHQTCVGGQRHQPMGGLDDLQTYGDALLGPPLNADAMGAHHLGEALKDGCRPGVGLLLR